MEAKPGASSLAIFFRILSSLNQLYKQTLLDIPCSRALERTRGAERDVGILTDAPKRGSHPVCRRGTG